MFGECCVLSPTPWHAAGTPQTAAQPTSSSLPTPSSSVAPGCLTTALSPLNPPDLQAAVGGG